MAASNDIIDATENSKSFVDVDIDHVKFETPPVLSTQSSESEVPERATWSAKIDFILSAVGYAVGFGNIWRFPHLCYSNGGGAFLIPYFFMMIFAGLPLFYLELAFGQYASLGPITIWRACPMFKGLGYTMIGISTLVSVYYNVILAFSIFYLAASFTSELPWAACGHWWNKFCSENKFNNDDNCSSPLNLSISNTSQFSGYGNISNITRDCYNSTSPVDNQILHSPAEEYWEYYVLGSTNETNIANIGEVRWHLTLCHLLAWIVVFLCIVKGVKTSGKVVYFTATFPYVVLFILFVRGVTLPGAGEGIKYYLVPDFSKMATVKVWNDAAIQILFSLGPGFGSLIMLGSYNKFNNKCNRDAIAVTLVNCFTSFFAGFVIFSVLGFMSLNRNVSVDEVVAKGPGLAFIAYPEAIAMMPGSPFWAICFFFMLFTLGLDSQFVGVECIITGLMDEFPVVARWKKTSTLIVCIVIFLAGLPCLTQGGMYVIELIDQFTTSFPLLIVTLLETIAICWIYGIKRLSSDIELMIGCKPNYYWLACWLVITPVIITFILIFKCAEYNGIDYADYHFPLWAEGVGWLMAGSLIAFIPLWVIIELCKCIGSWQNFWWVLTCAANYKVLNLGNLVKPSEKWGPAQVRHKKEDGINQLEVPEPDAGYAVAYHEGQCFVTENAFYSNDSHI